MAYQSVNPNIGEVVKSFEHLNDAQLDQAHIKSSPIGELFCEEPWNFLATYVRELGSIGIQEFVNKKLIRTGPFALHAVSA